MINKSRSVGQDDEPWPGRASEGNWRVWHPGRGSGELCNTGGSACLLVCQIWENEYQGLLEKSGVSWAESWFWICTKAEVSGGLGKRWSHGECCAWCCTPWGACGFVHLQSCSLCSQCLRRSYCLFFWLSWVFVATYGLSLVAASRGYSSLRYSGFSLRWLLLLQSMGSRHAGSVVVACGLSSCGSGALERRLSSCGART